jgi:hypothetical protein
LVILIILRPGLSGISHAATVIQGTVRDESGNPIIDAEVIVYQENRFLGRRSSGQGGVFEFEAEPGTSYTLYAITDLEESPGFDYLPSRFVVSYGQSANITLMPGGSLALDGDVQFVDSENLPTSYVYAILDPSRGEVIELDGLPLTYGSTLGSLTETVMLRCSSRIKWRLNRSLLRRTLDS